MNSNKGQKPNDKVIYEVQIPLVAKVGLKS